MTPRAFQINLASGVIVTLSNLAPGRFLLALGDDLRKRRFIQFRHFSAQRQRRPTDAETFGFGL